MKKLLTLLVFITMPLAPAMADKMMDNKMAKPSIYAVAYHSDNCGSCKILGPKVMETKSSIDAGLAEKVKFVKFDLTDETTKKASAEKASEHGLSAHYNDTAKTGKVKIIDAETGAVLAVLTKSFTVEEMKGVLKATAYKS